MNGSLSSNHTTEGVTDAQEDAQAVAGDIPANLIPLAEATADCAVETIGAMLLGGDWAKAEAAYDRMLTEQIRFQAGFIAASSGAATELDYYEDRP